jgi:hypothetical protein
MFNFTDIVFDFFFAPDYPITWGRIDHDSRYPVFSQAGIDQDSRFPVFNQAEIDHDSSLPIYNQVKIDHDTALILLAVSHCDTRYEITAAGEIDHDTRLVIEAYGIEIDQAAFFIIRGEDHFTN